LAVHSANQDQNHQQLNPILLQTRHREIHSMAYQLVKFGS
jgi:hypothetical protein